WDLKDNSATAVADGVYTYKIDAVDAATNAAVQQSGTRSEERRVGKVWGVSGSPDPTNSSSTISYSLSEQASVTLKIYDGSNVLVRTLVDGASRSDGAQSELWDLKDNSATAVADGVYTYKIDAVDAATNAAVQQSGT